MAWSNQSELFKMIILEFVCSQIFMLQRRKMKPDDFVDTRFIGFCYTCTSYRFLAGEKL